MEQAELAWPKGDQPGSSEYIRSVPESISSVLKTLLPKDIQDMVTGIFSITPNVGVTGRYQVSLDNSPPLFLRLTARMGYMQLETDLIRHAFAAGAAVMPAMRCEAVTVKECELRLDLRRFQPGDHPERTLKDTLSIARELKILHQSLRSFGGAVEVKDHALKRFARFQKISEQIAEGEISISLPKALHDWFYKEVQWLQGFAAHVIQPIDMIEDENSQCVHGEPTPANTLLTTDRAFFIDFEESVHIFATPLWDIAYLVQRNLLVNDADVATIGGWLEAVQQECGYSCQGVFEYMQGIAWSLLMMIIDFAEHQIETPVGECVKFKQLAIQAEELAAALPHWSK